MCAKAISENTMIDIGSAVTGLEIIDCVGQSAVWEQSKNSREIECN